MRSKQGSKGHLWEVKNKKEIIKPRAAKSGHGNLLQKVVHKERFQPWGFEWEHFGVLDTGGWLW